MTKPQVLFVDDEPLVLQGLQRMLRPSTADWDMAFVESGQAALGKLAEHPFDVIVSDMRMPGMNGAELLNEVMKRFPATVRIVLSGHADKDLVTQCIDVAHQYISKPCDPEQLKTMIRNACLLSGHLLDEQVRKVIGAIDRLPVVPEVYLELQEALKDEEANSRLLGSIIQQDIGMTAKVLKLVNSSFFGMRRAICDIQEAVAYLGIDMIRTLVLNNSIFDQSRPFQTRRFNISDLRHHSMTVAAGAKAIAQRENLGRSLTDQAFIGGVLHDVGVLVLASNFPETYDNVVDLVISEKATLCAAELECFGVTHAEVGAYLLGLWGLPGPILDIVSKHHSVTLQDEAQVTPLLAVHAADVLCGIQACHPLFEIGPLERTAMEGASLVDRLEAWEALAREAAAGKGGA